MNEQYWCSNHEGITTLDKHGRCSLCQSEAVDLAVHVRAQQTDEQFLKSIGIKEAM
jgi:hypothetical protein